MPLAPCPQSLGVEEGGLKSLIRATYKQLGLLTYFTTGEKETRAWTIHEGFTAPQAAGVIHTGAQRDLGSLFFGLAAQGRLVAHLSWMVGWHG